MSVNIYVNKIYMKEEERFIVSSEASQVWHRMDKSQYMNSEYFV